MPLKQEDLKTFEHYKKAMRMDVTRISSNDKTRFWVYRDVELPMLSGKKQKLKSFLVLVDEHAVKPLLKGKQLVCKGTVGLHESKVNFKAETGKVPYKTLKTSVPLLLGKLVHIPPMAQADDDDNEEEEFQSEDRSAKQPDAPSNVSLSNTSKREKTVESEDKNRTANAAISRTKSVQRKVANVNGNTVVTITIGAQTDVDAGGSAKKETAKLEGSGNVSRLKDLAMTFTLNPNDPDYKKKHDEVMAVTTADELRSLASKRPELLSSTTAGTTQGESAKAKVSAGPASVGANIGKTHREEETKDDKGAVTRKTEDKDTLGGTASGTGSRGGIDLGASKTESAQRKVATVNGKTVVTVTVTGQTELTVGGTVKEGVASMGVSQTLTHGKDLAMTFTLDPKDPEYKTKYAEVMAAGTADKLKSLAAKRPDLVGSTTTGTTESKVTKTKAGVGPLSGAITDGGTYHEEEIKDTKGVTHKYEGTGTLGAEISASKVTLSNSTKDSLSATVGPDQKGTAETKRVQTESDLGRSAATLAANLKANPLGTIKSVVTGKATLVQERSDSEGKEMGDDSIGQLAELAKNSSAWNKSWDGTASTVDGFIAWQALRPKILAAKGDRNQIAKLLAQFNGVEAGRSKMIEKATTGTGVVFEFPDSLSSQKPVFDELVVGNLPTGAAAELNAALQKLTRLQNDIQTHHNDFSNPATMAKMMDRISARQVEIRKKLRTLAPGQDENQKREARNDVVDRCVKNCLTSRADETRTFAEVEKELGSWMGSDYNLIAKKLNLLKDTYKTWDGWINELRAVYQERGESPDRANQFLPNRDQWNALYKKAFKGY